VSAPDDRLYRGDPPPYDLVPAPAPGPPPGYAPAYGVFPGYGPPGYGPRPRNNQLAMIALVLSFLGLLAPVGLALGVVARGQIRRTGEAGEGLALAAVIIGGVVTTVLVFVLVFWVLVLASIGGGALAP
jgi:Domain of unknown function (DUF4190)